MDYIQGTHARPGKLRKVRTHGKGRKCLKCSCTLSIYNDEPICCACRRKATFDESQLITMSPDELSTMVSKAVKRGRT